MILPIVAYGDSVLRKEAEEISKDYTDLDDLIDNMFETMYSASGVGLAAPQVGKLIRLFLVDTIQLEDDEDDDGEESKKEKEPGIKQAFINAQILERNGQPYAYNEGCLSIPGIREDVVREENIEIEYYDRNWKKHTKSFKGVNARVIMHEYDHIEGVLFLDHLKPLKKRLLKKQLDNITKGIVKVDYKMKFPKASKKR